MAFDAGTIIAHLDLETEAFDRKLRERTKAAERFEQDTVKAHQKAVDAQVAADEKAARQTEQVTVRTAERTRRRIFSQLGLGMFGMGGGGRDGSRAAGGGGNQGF